MTVSQNPQPDKKRTKQAVKRRKKGRDPKKGKAFFDSDLRDHNILSSVQQQNDK